MTIDLNKVKDHEDFKNQTVATLTMALDTTTETEARQFIYKHLQTDENMPSGATITTGTGVWLPDQEDQEDEIENNIRIEIWVDTMEELQAIEDFKDLLEAEFDQYCVCLSLEEKVFKH